MKNLTEQALRWHLTYNFIPALNEKTMDYIVNIYEQFKNGKLSLNDSPEYYAGTVSELLEDYKIEHGPF